MKKRLQVKITVEVDLPAAEEIEDWKVPQQYTAQEYEQQLEYEAALQYARGDDSVIEFWNCDRIRPENTKVSDRGSDSDN